VRTSSVRRPSLHVAAAALFGAVLAVALASGAPARPALQAVAASPHQSSKPRPRLPDGCGDAPTTNGRGNTRMEILCGGAGADKVYAGTRDIVKAGDGNDVIYARNGGPNDILGGNGSDTAYVDSRLGLDRWRGIQRRYTSMLRPRAPATPKLATPRGFPYELPTVECDDADDGSGGRHILLLDPPGQKPQMAAFNANTGVVDWQTVAWATVIYKWDPRRPVGSRWTPYLHTDWLWDRTYDLVDYREPKHPPNVWRSFKEGLDDRAAEREPFEVREPGRYNVRFRFYWYQETVPDLPDRDLADMPSEYLFTPARKVLGRYAKGRDTANQRYCEFP
jgi:hypothetical protein